MCSGGQVSDAAARTAALLKAMWEKNLPVLRERLGVLTAAAEAASAGTLSEERRLEAAGVAHKLAGSLGMFGYPEGTRLARELEVVLGETDGLNDSQIPALVHDLRNVLSL